MGRKSAYKEEYAQRAYELCLLGAIDTELAGIFGVSQQTLNSWKKQFPEFLESLKAGKEIADAQIASSLFQKALSGDTTACIFWLKNRRKQNWRDKWEETEDDGDNIDDITTVVYES